LPQGAKRCKRSSFPAERETLFTVPAALFTPMNNRPKELDEATQRRKRLAEALRENLKRRKAQIKARAAPDDDARKPHDSARIVRDK